MSYFFYFVYIFEEKKIGLHVGSGAEEIQVDSGQVKNLNHLNDE